MVVNKTLTPSNKVQFAVASSTATLATGPGVLRTANVDVAASAHIVKIYDNTSATGNPIFCFPASAVAGSTYTLNIPFTTALFITKNSATTGKFTFGYDQGAGG